MSLEAIIDAAATKAATVSGVKAAYGTGTIAGAPLPTAIDDGPIAIVMWTGSDVVIPTTFEEYLHRISVHIYVPGVDPGYAYKTLIPFVSRFITVWRLDRDLGGTCVESWVESASGIEAVTVNTRPYNRLSIQIHVRDVALGTTTSV